MINIAKSLMLTGGKLVSLGTMWGLDIKDIGEPALMPTENISVLGAKCFVRTMKVLKDERMMERLIHKHGMTLGGDSA
jgi:hypothetical protein